MLQVMHLNNEDYDLITAAKKVIEKNINMAVIISVQL